MGGPGGQHLQGLAHRVGVLDVLLGGDLTKVPTPSRISTRSSRISIFRASRMGVRLMFSFWGQGHLAEHGAGGELIVQDTALQGVIGELCAAGLFLFDGQRATSFKTE